MDKICSKCGRTKPFSAFCKDSGYMDGRRSDCNECRRLTRAIQDIRPEHSPPQFSQVPFFTTVPERELPEPYNLPAAYLKRCHDYWDDLLGGTTTKRIA